MERTNLHSFWIKCFIFVFTLIVFPILVISYSAERYTANTMLEQKRLSDLKDMQSLSISISTLLDSVESTGMQLASLPLEYIDKTFSTYLSDSICHISFLNNLGAFPKEHKLDRSRLSWFFNKTFMKELKNTDGYWSQSFSIEYVESNEIKRVISYIHPYFDRETSLTGYIVIFVSTDKFKDFLLPFGDSTFILENSCVFASLKEIPFYMKLFQIYNINYGYLSENNSIILNSGTTPYVTTTQGYERLGLQFVTMSSYNTLSESITIGFPGFYLMAIYGTIFAFISASILARLLTKPLLNLKNVMNHVKSGNFDIRYDCKGKDEVAELGYTFNSLLDTIQNLIRSLEKNYKTQQKIQFQLIQEQVNPHFLYNMLEMINSMIRSDMKNESISVVNNLAAFYRISLNNGSGIIRISQEIQLVESYLSLQKKRYIEFMDYTLAFSPNIYGYSIPKLTLQPLIENAIYHGLKEKCELGILCVSGYIENDRIHFEIYDTGCGISDEKIQEIMQSINSNEDIDNHFGLASVIRRLNYHCTNEAVLSIQSELRKYTCITISFPAVEGMR